MLFMCISHMYFFLIFLLFFIIIVYTMYLNMGSSVYLAMYFWKPAIKIYYYYYYYYYYGIQDLIKFQWCSTDLPPVPGFWLVGQF